MLTVSIVIPTLNSEKTLKDCLKSIAEQDYSRDNIEIIVADGGSADGTIEIINSINTAYSINPIKIVSNKLKTGEAGKAVGLRYAKNDIIAFIDSDNILPNKDWIKRMVESFIDPEIAASEPIEYTYRKEDGYITRYCALLGMNDPLCLFLGNYDRYSALTGKWTGLPVVVEDKNGYLKVTLNPKAMPTIGANGFLIRKDILEKIGIEDYFFDIDILCSISNDRPLIVAKVKEGIIHIFSGNISTFARKQRRRIRDYLYYNKLNLRKYKWGSVNKIGLAKFIFSCLFLVPLLFQSIHGYLKKPDIAWFFHPVACWITLWEYGWVKIGGIFGIREFGREGWKQ